VKIRCLEKLKDIHRDHERTRDAEAVKRCHDDDEYREDDSLKPKQLWD
jgi:hypothetical protein